MQPLSRVNVTELLRPTSGWNKKYLSLQNNNNNNNKHGNIFKNWLCPNFLLLPKKSELPKLWGGCSPPRLPGPYAYGFACHERLVESALKMLDSDESGLNGLIMFRSFKQIWFPQVPDKQDSIDKEKRGWEALGAVGRTHSCWFLLILNFILYKMRKNGRRWVSSLGLI